MIPARRRLALIAVLVLAPSVAFCIGAAYEHIQTVSSNAFILYSPEAVKVTLLDGLRGRFSVMNTGQPTLDLVDKDLRVRISIGCAEDGSPYIQLKDGKGNITWQVVGKP